MSSLKKMLFVTRSLLHLNGIIYAVASFCQWQKCSPLTDWKNDLLYHTVFRDLTTIKFGIDRGGQNRLKFRNFEIGIFPNPNPSQLHPHKISNTVQPRFSNIIHSRRLFEKRFVRKPKTECLSRRVRSLPRVKAIGATISLFVFAGFGRDPNLCSKFEK